MDNSEEFVYRGDGEEAEIVVYAPDAEVARGGFERAMCASALPGTESPVYAVAVAGKYGQVVASDSHMAPDLASVPGRTLLLSAEVPAAGFAENLGVSGEEIEREISRRMGEACFSVPRLSASGVRRICEYGAFSAAEDDLIPEDDLPFLTPFHDADADSIGRRAIIGGEREWSVSGADIEALTVTEILDYDALDAIGLEPERLVIRLEIQPGELGRLAFDLHRDRFRERVTSRVFDRVGGDPELYAAPRDTEEASDFLLACAVAANFTDGLASLSAFVLRRALRDAAGSLSIRASWRTGGVVEDVARLIHRNGLAAADERQAIFSRYVAGAGGILSAATGEMYGSVPTFIVREDEHGSPWQECGLLEEIASLHEPEIQAMG